jgi:hypothetical protein
MYNLVYPSRRTTGIVPDLTVTIYHHLVYKIKRAGAYCYQIALPFGDTCDFAQKIRLSPNVLQGSNNVSIPFVHLFLLHSRATLACRKWVIVLPHVSYDVMIQSASGHDASVVSARASWLIPPQRRCSLSPCTSLPQTTRPELYQVSSAVGPSK